MEAYQAIHPSSRVNKVCLTKLYINAFDPKMSYFLRRKHIDNINTAYCTAHEIEKILSNLRRSYGMVIFAEEFHPK